MKKITSFKDAHQHLKIFSSYLQIDFSKCHQMMITYFSEDLKDNVLSDKKRQIKKWWTGEQKPQSEQWEAINIFFRAIAEERGLYWDNEWMYQPVINFADNPYLDYAYERVIEPFALQRFFKFYYAKSTFLRIFTKNYCQPLASDSGATPIPKYYSIYRHFTKDNSLVSDLLKIVEPDEEKLFCTFYQYSDQDIKDPVYSEFGHIKNMRRYHGNVFFNRNCVNVSCASIANENEDGTEYVHLLFERFSSKTSALGLIMGLGDETRRPVCIPFVIRRCPATNPINVGKDINKFVKKIDTSFEEYQNITDQLKKNVSKNKEYYIGFK